jgi:large subunit ribosomal protein L6
MSRIGKLPISLPKGVSYSVNASNVVTIKGPKGELTQAIDPDITIEEEDGQLKLSRPTDQKRHKTMHGLYRSLVNNMVTGVSEGYKKELELIGVGYRAKTIGSRVLELQLGFSHPIYFAVPGEVTIEALNDKGKAPVVILESIDKQLIGQVAAKLRAFRKPEPYKGKGVRFKGEEVRRKAGKTAGK